MVVFALFSSISNIFVKIDLRGQFSVGKSFVSGEIKPFLREYVSFR